MMLKDIVRRLAGPTLLVAIGFVGHQLFVLGAEEINRAVLLFLPCEYSRSPGLVGW